MKVNHILAVFVWVAVSFALSRVTDEPGGFIFFMPFTLGPHVVSHTMCFFVKSRRAAQLLCFGMLAYLSLFFFFFINAFYIELDPQSGIILVFTGVISLPVMIPIWLISAAKERGEYMKRKR